MLICCSQKFQNFLFVLCLLTVCLRKLAESIVAFPRAGSQGYLAAVAMPLDLPNRNVYMAFNFEANYGLPPNDSYYYWIDRWNLDEEFVGIGNDVIPVTSRRRRFAEMYTRNAFYRSVVGYLEHYEMNGTGCLLRTICEVSASNLHEHNGLLGSIFKILFMPTTSAFENEHQLQHVDDIYAAEAHGLNGLCERYRRWCPHGLLELISEWF